MKGESQQITELLADIVEWGRRADTYVTGLDFDGFVADTLKQDATIRCLEVIGEAAGRILKLDPGFQSSHPALTLREAYRARNRTAHGYGSVDLRSVWETAKVSAPRMVAAAEEALASGGRNDNP